MAQTDTTAPGIPPQNLEAEESVLGAMMVSQSTIEPVLLDVRLQTEDFYRDRHRAIFEAIRGLSEDGDPVDVLTVTEKLSGGGQLEQVGGKDAVASLAAKVPAPGSAKAYAQIVKQNSLMRRLDAAAKQIQATVATRDGAPSEMVEQAERLLFSVAHEDRAADFREIGEILADEIDKLEALATGKAEVTGTPAGFRDLDTLTGGFQPGNLIVLAGRPAMGKCNRGSTLIYDPRTGRRRRLDRLVEDFESGKDVWTASLGADLKLRAAKASNAIRSGKQMVHRLQTRLGRRVEVTSTHPLLTAKGWRPLEELKPGDRIAVPRFLPRDGSADPLPDHEVVLLAALIADGSVIEGTPSYHFGLGAPLIPVVKAATEQCGAGFRVTSKGTSAYLSLGRGARSNPVTELCRSHGIWGKRAAEKSIPDRIFELPDWQVSRFLSVLYGCDGHVYAGERFSQIGYTTISRQLAEDVQHLLLRFGIVAKIRHLKRNVYEGTDKEALEVRITEPISLLRFATWIPVVGKQQKLTDVLERLATSTSVQTNVDTAPPEVWDTVLAAKGERPWAEVSEAAGYPRNHNWHVGKRGLSRGRLLQLSQVLEAPKLEELADSDIWWDEVEGIEEIGEEETYDLTIPDHHNFVADDVIVHNSAIVCNVAENVAMKADKAVALFSLEMSEMELAHRFIASQARIAGDRLRKGRVASKDWPKVVSACNALEASPLWIDDSSDLGLLDLRAKARRLHAQEKGRGRDGLGLVIVDYLQLMRADDPRANRVEQVGQFSRGLKILARELNVPVIGISQLSRAPEQRPDKRPILSDLRESGCLTGDSRVLLADGTRPPIAELEGQAGFHVLAMNVGSGRLEPRTVERGFGTGRKLVLQMRTQSGRSIRATCNHKFRSPETWSRLDQLAAGDVIALPEPGFAQAGSEVVWDKVVSIEEDGVEEVFDLTVEGLHNFVADDIVVHNSIEQDADLVGFLYRDEYYKGDESEDPGIAELIIAKHRNGPIGTVRLAFLGHYPKFADPAREERPIEQRPGEGPPIADLGGEGREAAGSNGANGSGDEIDPGDLDDFGDDAAEEF